MGCDMAVALGRATVDGHTLFGHNSGGWRNSAHALQRVPGRDYAAGEIVRTSHQELPQARRTFTVLAGQSAGEWGYRHGVNEHGVAVGCAALRTKFACSDAALSGPELARLALERSRSACQAVDWLTDLTHRFGQGDATDDGAADSAFLVADGAEAFTVETSGRYWVCQEARQVRAVSDVPTVHQDWDRICAGLSGEAIARGWWDADGSKLDFAAALAARRDETALRRWGRATLLLEQQNGHIDLAFLRRILSDHGEGGHDEIDPFEPQPFPSTICQHFYRATTAGSLVAELSSGSESLPVAWCAFGPPCLSIYFPILLDGELPAGYTTAAPTAGESVAEQSAALRRAVECDGERRAAAREALTRLQATVDQEADEFLAEGASLRQQGERAELERLATLFMQHNAERFEAVAQSLLHPVTMPLRPYVAAIAH
jgi:secernin